MYFDAVGLETQDIISKEKGSKSFTNLGARMMKERTDSDY